MADQAQDVSTEVSTPSGGSDHSSVDAPSRREERERARGGGTRRAIRKAVEQDGDKVSRGTVDGAENVGGEAAPKPWEAPAYAKAWNEQRRKALEAIATREDMKDHWKELDGTFNEVHQWDARRNWEIGQLRKNYEGLPPQLINQMRQQYQLQGMSLEGGITQLWGIAQQLAQNPDNTLAWLASQFKPRDANKFLQSVAQALGADLGQVAQGQPYVDPVVARELRDTRQRLEQMQQNQWQQQNAFRQQQYNALVQHITEFETAKDANGNLKHPYANDVGQDMGLILQTGRAQSLEQAYEIATKLHPKAQEDRVKAAEKAAREAAARNTTDAEQARMAGRNVASKPNGREHRTATRMEAILKAEKSVYGKTR